jgi:hypothetical protein
MSFLEVRVQQARNLKKSNTVTSSKDLLELLIAYNYFLIIWILVTKKGGYNKKVFLLY